MLYSHATYEHSDVTCTLPYLWGNVRLVIFRGPWTLSSIMNSFLFGLMMNVFLSSPAGRALESLSRGSSHFTSFLSLSLSPLWSPRRCTRPSLSSRRTSALLLPLTTLAANENGIFALSSSVAGRGETYRIRERLLNLIRVRERTPNKKYAAGGEKKGVVQRVN